MAAARSPLSPTEALILPDRKGGVVGKPGDQAALLIHRYKKGRAAGSLHIADKIGGLFGRCDILSEQDKPAHGVLGQRIRHGAGQFGHASPGGVLDLVLGLG